MYPNVLKCLTKLLREARAPNVGSHFRPVAKTPDLEGARRGADFEGQVKNGQHPL